MGDVERLNEAAAVTPWEDRLAKLVEKNPNTPWLLRLLGGLLPVVSGAFSNLDKSLDNAVRAKQLQRMVLFLEECRLVFPSSTSIETLANEEFVQVFSLVSRCVPYVNNDEKMRFFAFLLRHATNVTSKTELDEAESFVNIINDLS